MSAPANQVEGYDRPRDLGEVDEGIRGLASPLTPTGSGDLRELLETPCAELGRGADAVERLAGIARLLVKSGRPPSVAAALDLSFRIQEIERAAGGRGERAGLLRGLAQVAQGTGDLGVRNVLAALDGRELAPLEGALAHWALAGAAVRAQNLAQAREFAGRWEELARCAGASREVERARTFRTVLAVLFAEEGSPPAAQVHAELQSALDLPLLPGLDLCHAGPLPKDLGRAGLGVVWLARCTHPSVDSLRPLSEDRLLALARLAADWELARFLAEIEEELRRRDPEIWFESALGRLLGREAAQTAMAGGPPAPGEALSRDVVVWTADVRGFSSLCERMAPEDVFRFLRPIFKVLNEELEEAGGRILEFVGDAILVVFGAFGEGSPDLDRILSRTATALSRLFVVGALTSRAGAPEAALGIGIQRGPAALGNLGSLRRCHFTVLGDTVNQAARLEGLTKKTTEPVAVEASLFGGEPQVWRNPRAVTYSLRDRGHRALRNIARPARVYGLAPLLRYWIDFVPMGFVDVPPPGIIYVDAGNVDAPGVLDHHWPGCPARSACEYLVSRPERLLRHVAGLPKSSIEFRLHRVPDLDGTATFYAACELLEGDPRGRELTRLASYVSDIDQGLLPSPETLADSLHGVFLAHHAILRRERGRDLTDWNLLEAGLRVVDAAMFLLEEDPSADPGHVFSTRPAWFACERSLLAEDRTLYAQDRARGRTYQARVRGLQGPREGLLLDHPRSLLFKFWARNDPEAPGGLGFPFLAVDWSEPGRNRFVISVDPESGTDLDGLGQALEVVEAERRRALGLPRPIEPRRHPADNADPWYFGQGHRYTIVDSPGRGTVLGPEEVMALHEAWEPCGGEG
ncbi:MAG: adenylate/guanylate cyclase domain-containing protein [Planctomycetes bacterium]|nr:adenylate/guanylate cyclase domain-containing protein [Planctomycetota bacterium]